MTNIEMEVRLNWDKALTRWENKEFSLSRVIGWGFYMQDLLILCCLHEAGKHRQSIIDLLEDCNFHYECGLLSEGRYEECRKYIIEDSEGNFPLD